MPRSLTCVYLVILTSSLREHTRQCEAAPLDDSTRHGRASSLASASYAAQEHAVPQAEEVEGSASRRKVVVFPFTCLTSQLRQRREMAADRAHRQLCLVEDDHRDVAVDIRGAWPLNSDSEAGMK